MGLTHRQERFCEEYVIDCSVSHAAIRAGYNLLKNPGSKYFVYLLINPKDNSIFYIGKGKGRRPYSHKKEVLNANVFNKSKSLIIRELIEDGLDYKILYFKTNLNEQDAFSLESSLIKKIGETTTNISKGRQSKREKQIEWAKETLNIVLPFDKWILLNNRTPKQIELYTYCLNTIKSVANGTEELHNTFTFTTDVYGNTTFTSEI